MLDGPEGRAYQTGLGERQDAEMPILRVAALSRIPTRCPDDALDHVGAWFNIPRFAGEPDGTTTSGYRGRLCAAWDTWKKAGSKQAIIDSLTAYGFVDVQVFTTEDWTSPIGSYSDFWVVLGPDFGTFAPIEPLVMPFTMGTPTTLGTTATSYVINAIKGQILKWKAAHARPVEIVFYFSGVLLGAPLTMPFTLGGSSAHVPVP
jgi:hypothetical protein